jgi:hypothetical protein
MRRIFILLAASTLLCAITRAQDDAPSLGDVARQARAQKQQKDALANASTKDTAKTPGADTLPGAANSKDTAQPKTAHVITNEELSNHSAQEMTAARPSDSKDSAKDATKDSSKDSTKDSAKDAAKDSAKESKESSDSPAGDRDAQAEQWREQIQAQKGSIAQLQREISDVSDSIHYVGGNCVENCEQWNEHQQAKQSQVDSMKAELEAEQHHLEEMQDTARKQGFGSNVYDP